MNLSTKLVASFLGCGLLPLGVMAYIGYASARSGMTEVSGQAGHDLEQQVFDRLSAIRAIKGAAIERYFQTIHDQILTFSEDRMVVEAMRDFREYFRSFREENGITPEDVERMRKELYTYYTDEFNREYANQNGRPFDVASRFRQLDDDSIALQYQYIKANPNPLGSKHLLDRAPDDSRYSTLHGEVHPAIRSFLEKFGYYDIFLVDPDTGDILYSVFKELDYSTSLQRGLWSDTNFGEAFRQANAATNDGAVVLLDFKQYTPSYEAPASFIASPIFDQGEKIGVALFQMPLDRITAVMSDREGLGKTGESYLVGPDHLMRSDSYNDPEKHSVIASFRAPQAGTVETSAVQAALQGQDGTQPDTSYLGSHVLSAYGPVDVGGIQWALVVDIARDEALAAVSAMEETTQTANGRLVLWITALGAVAAVLVTLVSVFIARSISKPINNIIGSLTEGADQVSEAAGQVAGASQSLAEGSSEQASSLEETSSALEEMAAMTRTNAENAKKANELSDQARQAAQGGDQTMAQLSTAMAAINDSAGQISKIIKVIEEIAFQTNLLALNAAVEAARAGEHGKGFAVVADEVRNLAMRAAEAAKETTALIEGSVANAREGTDVANQVGEALAAIVGDVTKVTELINGIAQASQDQAQGVDQLNAAASQMEKQTQQAAAGAEESASASQELASQAQAVKSAVNDLAALVHGRRLDETAGSAQQCAAAQPARRAKPKARQQYASRASQPVEFGGFDTQDANDLGEF